MQTEDFYTLKTCPLFGGIDPESLRGLVACLSPIVRTYQKEDIILNADERIPGVGVILSGWINVTRETAKGDRIILARLSQGDIFGEVAVFSNNQISVATVFADSACRLIFIPPEKITTGCEHACSAHGMLIRNMLAILADKAMVLNKKIGYLMIKSMRGKISAYLLGIHHNTKKTTLTLPYNRNELADYLGVSRPSMSRELGRMRDEGVIAIDGRQVTLKDLAALKVFAEQ